MTLSGTHLQALNRSTPLFMWALLIILSLVLFDLLRCPVQPDKADSINYFTAAYTFRRSGIFELDPMRAPGYQLFNAFLAKFISHPDEDFKLAKRSVNLITVLYLQAIFLLALAVRHKYGNLPALISLLPFTLDHWNHLILRSALSEGLARVLVVYWLTGVALAFGNPSRKSGWLVFAASAGVAVTVRENLLPLVMITGVVLAIQLLRHRRIRLFLLGLALLSIPLGGWLAYNAAVNGVYGFSARGNIHLAGRTIPLARPDRIEDWGKHPKAMRLLFTTVRKAHANHTPDPDYVHAGLTAVPLHKGAVRNSLHGFLGERGKPASTGTIATLAGEASRLAFWSNPWDNMKLTLTIFAENLTAPFFVSLEGEGREPIVYISNALMLLALTTWLMHLIRRQVKWDTTMLLASGIGFFLLYQLACAAASPYMPRYVAYFNFAPTVIAILYLARLFETNTEIPSSQETRIKSQGHQG